jgi:hypothetical protein
MSRSRNIKPGFYKNEELAECSIWARFIYPGLWMLADREGRLEDRPKRIKGELLPFDTIEVESLLTELASRNFILRYEANKTRYIQIIAFAVHQSPHYSEKASAIPAPYFQEHAGDKEHQTPGVLPEHSRSDDGIKRGSQPPDSLIPDSLIPDSLIPDSDQASAVEQIPLRDGTDFAVTQAFAAEMRKAYPHIDVKVELGKMRAWAVANPGKRKTRAGMARFVNGWLAGAAEKPASKPAPAAMTFVPDSNDVDYLMRVGI